MFNFHQTPGGTACTVPPDVISRSPHVTPSGAMKAADRIADRVMRPEDGRRPKHRPQDVELNRRTSVPGERTE